MEIHNDIIKVCIIVFILVVLIVFIF